MINLMGGREFIILDHRARMVKTLGTWDFVHSCLFFIETSRARARTPWPDDAPTQALRLPSRCAVLELSWKGRTQYVAAVYNLADGAESTGQIEITLHLFFDRQHRFFSPEARRFNPVFALTDFGRWVPMCVLHLAAETLGGAVRLAESLAAVNPDDNWLADWDNQLSGLALMVLLYLSGEPDVVRIIHEGEKPAVKQSVMRRDPERFKDLQEPLLNLVGTAFTRAIERWEIERFHDSDSTGGGSFRPHMRRAHTHLYWTSEGRKVPRVRFLLPISVKGGKLVEEPESSQVTTVR